MIPFMARRSVRVRMRPDNYTYRVRSERVAKIVEIKNQIRRGDIPRIEGELQLQALGDDLPRGHPLRSRYLSVTMQDFLISARALGHAVTPLDFMMATLMSPEVTFEQRMWAAEKAAPYMHRKMPLAIEGGDPSKPLRVATSNQLRTLSPEEFAQLVALSAKLEQAVPSPEDVMKQIAEVATEESDDSP